MHYSIFPQQITTTMQWIQMKTTSKHIRVSVLGSRQCQLMQWIQMKTTSKHIRVSILGSRRCQLMQWIQMKTTTKHIRVSVLGSRRCQLKKVISYLNANHYSFSLIITHFANGNLHNMQVHLPCTFLSFSRIHVYKEYNNRFLVTREAFCQQFSIVTVFIDNCWQICPLMSKIWIFTVTFTSFYISSTDHNYHAQDHKKDNEQHRIAGKILSIHRLPCIWSSMSSSDIFAN